MRLRVAPSAIELYLHENSFLYALGEDGVTLLGVYSRVPANAGSVISVRLTPVLEDLIQAIYRLAVKLRKEKNGYRRFQRRYELLHLKSEDYDEAARSVTKELLRYIYQDLLDNIGGRQRGETKEPNEPSKSTDP